MLLNKAECLFDTTDSDDFHKPTNERFLTKTNFIYTFDDGRSH